MTGRKTSAAKWAAVLITISSWIAVSNHCALAAIAASASSPAADEQCPMHSPHKPAKQNDAGVMLCCKTLRALAASPAKTFVRGIVDLKNVDLVFAKFLIFAPPKLSFSCETLDTGPPGTSSFAESVLQRSILAHAPPSLA